MDSELRKSVASIRDNARKVVNACDDLLRSLGDDAAADIGGVMGMVYEIACKSKHQGRITRKRIVSKAMPVVARAYPKNNSVEQTIQNALNRLVKRGLLARNGYGGYVVVGR